LVLEHTPVLMVVMVVSTLLELAPQIHPLLVAAQQVVQQVQILQYQERHFLQTLVAQQQTMAAAG
jgi:hypothetical protein